MKWFRNKTTLYYSYRFLLIISAVSIGIRCDDELLEVAVICLSGVAWLLLGFVRLRFAVVLLLILLFVLAFVLTFAFTLVD